MCESLWSVSFCRPRFERSGQSRDSYDISLGPPKYTFLNVDDVSMSYESVVPGRSEADDIANFHGRQLIPVYPGRDAQDQKTGWIAWCWLTCRMDQEISYLSTHIVDLFLELAVTASNAEGSSKLSLQASDHRFGGL